LNDPTYISVDLDYWKKFPGRFIWRMINLGKPIAVSYHHHALLRHMNSFSFSRLVNIDCHSDMCEGHLSGQTPVPLVDGSWANFVKASNMGEFIWVYPNDDCVNGESNNDHSCFCNSDPDRNPFLVDDPEPICGWEKLRCRKRPFLTKDEEKSAVAVGICLSPEYSPTNFLMRFDTMMANQGIDVDRIKPRERKLRRVATA